MPIGGDLGFSYLVLVVPLLALVIALVVRRNWQLSVARSEEIQRLLVLAPVPFISRPLQYQCAVCFSPTTTRCARCKAVRYCSGTCQIVHWRQGHKDECHPFTIPHQLKDVGCGSNQKVLEQGVDMQGTSSETGGTRCAESVPNSELNCSPVDFCGNRHNEVECLADGISIGSSSDETERAGGHPSSNFFPEKVKVNGVSNVDQNGPPSLKHTTSVIHVDHLTHSGNRNKIKPHRTNHDDEYRSTSSSGCNTDGTNECSFSNLYTPSGF